MYASPLEPRPDGEWNVEGAYRNSFPLRAKIKTLMPVSGSRPKFTSHDINERDRLLRSRVYGKVIQSRPDLLALARTYIAALIDDDAHTTGHLLWRDLLAMDASVVIEKMTEDSSTGRHLRSNNPFSILIGCTDEDERRASWLQAKADLLNNSI